MKSRPKSYVIIAVFILCLGSKFYNLTYRDNQDVGYQFRSNLQPAQKTSSSQVLIPSVPYHHQINSYYCGSASLEMIFDYYGPDISQTEIAEVARTYKEGGTYTFDLRRAAHFSENSVSNGLVIPGHINGYTKRKIGYVGFESNLQNTTCLKCLIDKGHPILIITWSNSEKINKHFRVVVGYRYEDNEILSFILNDPAHGENYEIVYIEFVDLWSSNGNWSLFVSPWIMNITYVNSIQIDSTFLVTAEFQYPCPSFFDENTYPVSECSAIIKLPSGFSLTLGENKTKIFNNGTIKPRDVMACSWNITSGSRNKKGTFNIEICGKINGRVPEHYFFRSYSYSDYIGGSYTFLVEITGGFPTQLVIIVLSISFSIVGVGGSIILIRKRVIKRRI